MYVWTLTKNRKSLSFEPKSCSPIWKRMLFHSSLHKKRNKRWMHKTSAWKFRRNQLLLRSCCCCRCCVTFVHFLFTSSFLGRRPQHSSFRFGCCWTTWTMPDRFLAPTLCLFRSVIAQWPWLFGQQCLIDNCNLSKWNTCCKFCEDIPDSSAKSLGSAQKLFNKIKTFNLSSNLSRS